MPWFPVCRHFFGEHRKLSGFWWQICSTTDPASPGGKLSRTDWGGLREDAPLSSCGWRIKRSCCNLFSGKFLQELITAVITRRVAFLEVPRHVYFVLVLYETKTQCKRPWQLPEAYGQNLLLVRSISFRFIWPISKTKTIKKVFILKYVLFIVPSHFWCCKGGTYWSNT